MTTTPFMDRVEEGAHGVHGRAVGLVLVPEADPVAGGDGRGLGDADQLKGEVAVRLSIPQTAMGRVEYAESWRCCHVILFFECRLTLWAGRRYGVRLLPIRVAAARPAGMPGPARATAARPRSRMCGRRGMGDYRGVSEMQETTSPAAPSPRRSGTPPAPRTLPVQPPVKPVMPPPRPSGPSHRVMGMIISLVVSMPRPCRWSR